MTSPSPIKRVVAWVLCAALAAMWFASAGHKLADPVAFAKIAWNYRILPDGWPVNATAAFLPWLEVMTGLGLLLPFLRAGAARISTALMAFFTVLIAISIFRGIEGACGCMAGQRIGWWKAGENVLWLLASIAVWALDRKVRAAGQVKSARAFTTVL